MFKPKCQTASNSKITKNSQLTLDQKYMNSQRTRLRLVKSELRLNVGKVKSVVAQSMTKKGKPTEFLESRRESILNSNYNQRKSKLVAITKENRKIYDRINSQKSNYSSRVLNKSYDSVCSHSSRVSHKSSGSRSTNVYKNSRNASIKNRRLQFQAKRTAQAQPILKAQNINRLQKQQILHFNKIFMRSCAAPPLNPPKHRVQDENKMAEIVEEQAQLRPNPPKSMYSENTPDRRPGVSSKNHHSSIRLPEIKETTPQRKGNLEKIIESLGYRYRY